MSAAYILTAPIRLEFAGAVETEFADTLNNITWNLNTTTSDTLVINSSSTQPVAEFTSSGNTRLRKASIFNNSSGSISLTIDPTQTVEYDLPFPIDPPQNGQVWTFNGGSSSFQNLIDNPENSLIVRTDPQQGQFDSVIDAIASIPTIGPGAPSDTNRYVIYVYRGDYGLGQTAILPPYVYIVGESMEAVRFYPTVGGFDLFEINNNTGIVFASIQNVASPNHAVLFNNVGDYALIHKMEVNNCPRGMYFTSSNTDCLCYLEYVGFTDSTEYTTKVVSSSGYTCQLSVENFFVNNYSDDACLIDGPDSLFLAQACVFQGTGSGNAITATNGSRIDVKSAYMQLYERGICAPNDSGSPILMLSSILFDDVTINIDIQNPNATGHYDGYSDYSKTVINSSSTFFIANQDRNVITVAKKGGNFTSVKSAVESITDATLTNRYVVYIGPGIYVEDPFTIPSNVTVKGFYQTNCTLVCSNPATRFITGSYYASLEYVTLTMGITSSGTPPSGGVLLAYDGEMLGRSFRVQNVVFNSAETLYQGLSTSGASISYLTDCLVNMDANFVNGFVFKDGTAHNPVYTLMDNITWSPGAQYSFSEFVRLESTSSGPTNVIGVFSDFFAAKTAPNITGKCFTTIGASRISIDSSIINGLGTGFYIPNTTVPAPEIQIVSTAFKNTQDIDIQHAGVLGSVQIIADRTKVFSASNNLGLLINGYSGDISLTGNIYQGLQVDRLTNITDQIQHAASTGIVGEITLTSSGLDIFTTSGKGYLHIGPLSDDYLWYVTWPPSSVTVPANNLSWLFIDSSGNFQSSLGEPSFDTDIILGSVKTNASGVSYIQQVQYTVDNVSSRIENGLRSSFGPIVESGLLSTPNNTSGMRINVSSGSYWYGSLNFTPTTSSGISMYGYYRNTSGSFNETAPFSVLTTVYDNGSGSLVNIPLLSYVKHALFVIGDGSDQSYALVYGQETFASLLAAQQGPLPSYPSTLVANACPITGVIMTFLDTTLSGNRFQDVRPTPSFKAAGVTASADHNSLLNLTVGDAHCFSEDTELLTETGFVSYWEIDPGKTKAVTLDLDSGRTEYNLVWDKFVYDDYSKMISIKNSDIDALVTEDHTMIAMENSKYFRVNAKDLLSIPQFEIPLIGKRAIIEDDLLNDLDYYLLMGFIFISKNRNILRIPSRLKERLIKLLEKNNVGHNITIPNDNEYIFTLSKEWIIKEYERFVFSPQFLQMTTEVFSSFLLGLLSEKYDISRINSFDLPESNIQFRTIIYNKKLADRLQHLFQLNGIRSQSFQDPSEKNKYVIIFDKRASTQLENINCETVPYSGNVWCVSVFNKTLVLRRNGKIFIAGNTQYLRTDGTRALTGDLDLGTNDIVNASLINGMDILAHASRHAPGGADPLTTAAPVTISTANSEGIATSFARSDHVHNHGNQTGGSLHAVVTGSGNGFMDSSDKTKLDNSTSTSSGNTLVLRDSSGNFHNRVLQLDDASRTRSVNLSAPITLTSTYNFVLPPALTTTSGYILMTDSSGNTAWNAQSTGFSDPMTTAGDMIYRNTTNITTRLPAGSIGQYLTINSSSVPAWSNSATSNVITFFDDFRGGASPFGDTNWIANTGGTGSTVTNTTGATGNWLGVTQPSTGSTSSGYALVRKGGSDVRLGLGSLTSNFYIYIDNLASVGQNYNLRIGFGNAVTSAADFVNGIYFLHNAPNNTWTLRCISGGTATNVTSSSTVVEDAWTNLGLNVNSAGNLVTFLVNGVSVGTISTNIPSSTQQISPIIQIAKTASTAARTVTVDYMNYTYNFTGTR